MKDLHNREINYLRISVTDRCNLKCQYCMPDNVQYIEHENIIRFEEIIRICQCSAKLGIKYIKITGGEPLMRKGVTKLIKEIKAIEGIEQVSLTTNGVLVPKYVNELCSSGLDAINISLDTLDRAKYYQITGHDALDEVLKAIDLIKLNNINLKINYVVLKDINYDEVPDMMKFSINKGIPIRFIDVMPIGQGKKYNSQYDSMVVHILSQEFGEIINVNKKMGNGPAKYYKIKDLNGIFGIINPIHGKFCDRCNRIRLTSDGLLKSCLYFAGNVNLKDMIRKNCSDEELMNTIKNTIKNKYTEHNFNGDIFVNAEDRKIFQIGG